MEINIERSLNTDVQAGLELGTFRSRERCLTARPHLHLIDYTQEPMKLNSVDFVKVDLYNKRGEYLSSLHWCYFDCK